MDIARTSIEKPVNTWLIVMICLLGGIWALLTIGRLEDPAFTLKQALVVTPYPGATAQEVEEEVTELLESTLQQLPQLKRVKSKSSPGLSEIEIEIKDTYDGPQMPQVWDEVRRKVGDAQPYLPPGAGNSMVNDDFGDVFGLFYAVTAEGFTEREIHDLSTFLRRELLTVKDVAKVETRGEQTESIYIDVTNERMTSLGIDPNLLAQTLQSENAVADAGAITVDDRRVRLISRPGFDSVASIEAVRVGTPGSTEQLSLLDIADIYRSTTEIPSHLVRFNGKPAFTLAISAVAGTNIVEVGQRVSQQLDLLKEQIPLGIEINPIYEQHVVVDESINSFVFNLALAVVIVIGVLCLFMGWRVGFVVGATLLLTVLGTVFFMRLFSIEMERISLGALIIAMGMLVDNAIVIAEGMLINMQRGISAKTAASDAAKRTQIPLLGATVIGIMAFSGIGLSPDSTGEFLFSLFAVIGISLLLSWVLAITVTPLFGYYMLKVSDKNMKDDPYDGTAYRLYQRFLNRALRARGFTVIVLLLLTSSCFYAFGFVKQAFFPDSNTPIFYVNYQLPQGTDIRATARDMAEIDEIIRQQPGVVAVTTLVGQGASRFMLTYNPEQPNTAYGQFIIEVEDRLQIDPLAEALRRELPPTYPDADIRTQKLVFGPGSGAKIEARFSGPDAAVLRQLGDEAISIMQANGNLQDIRQNWNKQELVIVPLFNEERARIAGLGRTHVAETLQFATVGIRAGTYREGDEQIPIIARPPADERLDADRLEERLIWSPGLSAYIPITQVVERFITESEETLIHRRDRVRTLTVQAEPKDDLTADAALRAIRASIEAIDLPQGYRMQWGGEFESSSEAQASLGAQLPLGFLIMLLISILLFGKLRQPLIIWLVVPMSVCGVVIGLLGSGMPFGFMALLGFLSLSGMLMKNAIVLVDEIDSQISGGKDKVESIIDASVSRLRPVFLAAVTTILGMLPLLTDAFFSSMAVTIMGGLAFATLLTLIAVPVFYALLFGIKPARKIAA
ncbi:efflux RND transporter permease subunit [Nitrincola sp. MINF-07-Sa-05]|uniref:efflux RND transporter permease subunit n=1 Tax=Nitrincola salilacus TaxID=3400273 RepID=UPI0039180134